MTLAHHDTARCNQRRGGKAVLVCTEQRTNGDIAPCPQPAINLNRDAAAQIVHHQGLLGFGKAYFPGGTSVLDRRQRRCAGAAFETGNRHVIGTCFRDAGRYRADPDFRHQLHADRRSRRHVLQIEDKLRQVLDGIDIMMRRRRDQTDTGSRMPNLGDDGVNLVARQLSAFTRFRALCHFDLDHIGIDQIFGCHAKSAGRDLLDRRTHGIAVFHRHESVGFFTTFAGVRLPANSVHRNSEIGMGLAADRPEGHRTGGKSFDDIDSRFDLVQRHGRAAGFCRRLQTEQTTQRHQLFALFVYRRSIGPVFFRQFAAYCMLQVGDCLGRPGMLFTADAIRVFTTDIERVFVDRIVAERIRVTHQRLGSDLRQPDTLDCGMGSGEIFFNKGRLEPDRIEYLRTAIGLIGRNAHLGHHLQQPLVDTLYEALVDFIMAQIAIDLFTQIFERLEGKPRIDRFGAKAGESGEMMDFACFAGFHNQADRRSKPLADQVMVHSRRRQQRGYRHPVSRQQTIRQNDNVIALGNTRFGTLTEVLNRLFHILGAALHIKRDVERNGLKLVVGDIADSPDFLQPFI